MELVRIAQEFSVCKVEDYSQVDLTREYCFIGKTDEERSLVCLTADKPCNVIACEDGWMAFRVNGTLDFALIGILSRIAGLLADEGIGIFAISTYNTDYILVKRSNYEKALAILSDAGYDIL